MQHALCTSGAADKATLYYDGACPICSSEVARLEQMGAATLNLVDIHGTDVAQIQAEKIDLLKTLHYATARGEILTGIDANIAAWQHTSLGFLWRWLRWPLIYPMARQCYNFWARIRFDRLYGRSQTPGN